MVNKTKVFHKWIVDDNEEKGITLEIIFDKYRFGLCFYPNNECGWWLIGKTDGELDITEETISPEILKAIKEILCTQ